MKRAKKLVGYRNNSRGFSLLEILLAAALGLFLLEVVYHSYLIAKKIYREQYELSCLNENLRLANLILWQNIMQAGFAGYRKFSELELDNHHTGLRFGIHGYDSEHLPTHLLNREVKQGTDVIEIGKVSTMAGLVKEVASKATSFEVINNPTTEGNRYLLITDCEKAELFQAENHDARTVRLASGDSLNYAYKPGSCTMVSLFEELTFFIRKSDRKDERQRPIYSLYVSRNHHPSQELVEGITRMQVSYGVSQGGGIKYLRAREITEEQWDQVSLVTIELTLQSGSRSASVDLVIRLRERG